MDKKIYELASKVADRAVAIRPDYDKLTVFMDLTKCIEGGCGLRLEEMLEARPADLMHDIIGINQHLDHTTGELRDCFWPRFAK